MARTKGCLSEQEWIKCPKSPHVLGQLMSAGSLAGFVLAVFAKCQCSGRKDIFKIFFFNRKANTTV